MSYTFFKAMGGNIGSSLCEDEKLDLAKELMMIRPDIPIILCTGYSEQIDERGAEEIGISAFLMKPIVMRDIANTIREVLDNKK